MKISNQQYAQALYEATKEKSRKEIDSVISDWMKVLIKDNKFKNVNLIIKKFNDVLNKEEKIVEAEVATSRKLKSRQVHKVESYLKEKYKAEKVLIDNKVDPSIKGGIIIRVGDEVLDGSVEGYLKDLRRKLVT